MTIIDAHLHCTGRERAADVLRTLDEAGVDHAVLLAPFLEAPYSLDDPGSLRRANAHLASLVRGHTDRLSGFAVVNPVDADAARELRDAIEVLGCGALQFGSDCFLLCSRAHLSERIGWVLELVAELGLPADEQRRLWSGTAAAWLRRGIADAPFETRGGVSKAKEEGPQARPRHSRPSLLSPGATWSCLCC